MLFSPIQVPAFNPENAPAKIYSLVRDYATTLSSIADDHGDPSGERSYIMEQQQSHASENFGSMQLGTSDTYDDSGYTEFKAELQNRLLHLLQNTDIN